MLITLLGIVIFVKLSQRKKASFPILFTLFPIAKNVKPEQFSKA